VEPHLQLFRLGRSVTLGRGADLFRWSRAQQSWRLQGRCNCLSQWWLLASRYWMA